MIYNDSITAVEYAAKVRGHFSIAKVVRQDALRAFTMAFDPIFRWLHDAVIPIDLSRPPCLQATPRACANDFAVAAPSFWTLMPAIAPAFRTQDTVAGTSLKNKKDTGGSMKRLIIWTVGLSTTVHIWVT